MTCTAAPELMLLTDSQSFQPAEPAEPAQPTHLVQPVQPVSSNSPSCAPHRCSRGRRGGARRLPWWIRRAVRAWSRLTRWAQPAGAGGDLHRGAGSAVQDDLGDLLADESRQAAERRCGWFDLSQDLREGLCISVHDEDDAVAAQLPVMAWVQWQLSGWRPALALESMPALEVAQPQG